MNKLTRYYLLFRLLPCLWTLSFAHADLICDANKGDVSGVRTDFAAGADVNAKDNVKSQTALTWAAANGHLDCVNALIAALADVNAVDIHGSTSLEWAASLGRLDCVNALIAASADVNAKDNDGKTALKWTTLQGHRDCVAVLKAAGVTQ